MTEHPVKAWRGSKAAVRVFEEIASGERTPRASPATLRWLLDHKLIRFDRMKTVGKDRFGFIEIPEYSIPLEHHIEWCEWCSEQPEPVNI